MKKEIINYLLFYFLYFLFVFLVNRLFSFNYWPFYIGGLVGMVFSCIDHFLHVFIFKPQELTSTRIRALIKQKQYKEALLLLYGTSDERKDLVFHTVLFQIVFAVLTFWIVSSSGNLFGRGLVMGYFLSLAIYNIKKFLKNEVIFEDLDKTKIYIFLQVFLLLFFGLLV